MGDVTAVGMDTVTEKSGHQVTGMAVSVCITPAAPSPLPIPYPTMGTVAEGIVDEPIRTKINGAKHATVGSCVKVCHGNEPGTLKEVLSLNTSGPSFLLLGAPTVLCELGMMGITGSLVQMNKAITVGAPGSASDAGGSASGGGGGGGGGSGGSAGNVSGPSSGGGGDGSATHQGAAPPGAASAPKASDTCQGGHPVDLASGAVVDSATDVEIPGLIPLVFKRSYSSLRHEDRTATLGPGWAHSFEQHVVALEKTIALRDGEGRSVYFTKIARGESAFHRRDRLTLQRTGDSTYRLYDHQTRQSSVFAPALPGGPSLLARIEDPYGNVVRFEYEGGRLARVIDTGGRELRFAWQGGRIVSLTAPGLVVSYRYDPQGRLVAVGDAYGAETYAYDEHSRMVSTTTRGGTSFQYEYQGLTPRCACSWGPQGLYQVDLERIPEKRTTLVNGEEPRVVVWNRLGLVERLLLPDGTLLEEAGYDDDGLVIAKSNGAGEGSRYWYDAKGRRIRERDAEGGVTAYEYEGDNLVRITGPDGHVTRMAYDDKGGLVRLTYAWGEWYALSRDKRGRVVEVSGNLGRLRSYEYDDKNNLVAETDSRGAKTTYAHDAMGRPISRRDALGREARASFDGRGRRTSVTATDGARTEFAYDAMGHLTKVKDALGRVTEYQYGGLHALRRVITPDLGIWKIEHTLEERVRKVTNPLGEEYLFERDLAGRVVRETSFDGRTLEYGLDLAGRVVKVTYPDGDARHHAYDRMGRLLRDTTRESSRVFQRDVRGLLRAAVLEDENGRHELRFERDEFGRLIGEASDDRRVRYELDEIGRRTRRVLPNGATTSFDFDAEGALTGVTHDGFRLDFERDVLGRELARSQAEALRIASRYDDADRLIEQRATTSAGDGDLARVLVDRRFRYDEIGRVREVEDARWGITRYAYDGVNQLLEARRGAYVQAFSYDAAGSILAALEGLDGGRGRAQHEVGPGNVLLRAGDTKYAYDKRGRRARKVELSAEGGPKATEYEWDARDLLRGATLADGTRVEIDYDAIGRRVRKRVRGGGRSPRTMEYVWDGDVLAMQVDSVDGVRAFVHRPGTFVPLLHQERGVVFSYVVDQVGAPTELLAADGTLAWSGDHGPWGVVRAEQRDPARPAVDTPLRLAGQIADSELGLCFTRFRLFDPAVGRWISPDPVGLEGGRNLYAFDGAPTLVVDPYGLAPDETSGEAHAGALVPYYPPNDGFAGPKQKMTLAPGTKLDRFGGPHGRFVSPEGVPMPMRALPYDADLTQYRTYVVKKPLEVEGGKIAPAFMKPGGGTQYVLPRPASELVADGYLEEVKKP